MFRTTAIGITTALSLSAGGANAADADGRYAIDGPGIQTCAAFLETAQDQKSTEYAVYAGWVMGYVTMANKAGAETFDLTPWQSVEVLLFALQNLCKNNGEARFDQAMSELLKLLQVERLQTADKAIQFAHEGKAVVIYQSVLDEAQAALKVAGHDHDNSPKAVASALLAYQAAKGMPQTGLPDVSTLFNLFLE